MNGEEIFLIRLGLLLVASFLFMYAIGGKHLVVLRDGVWTSREARRVDT